jgi:DNA-binding beta-propeller fold protein YncE
MATFDLMLLVAMQAAAPQGTELLYVGNNHGGTISVIDVARLEVIGEFSAIPDVAERKAYPGGYVDDVLASPDGRVLYASRAALGDIAAFSTATEELLWRLPIPGTPDHFALSSDGRRLYLSVISRTFSLVIDTERPAIVAWWETGPTPHGMFLSPDEQRVYTGCIRCDQMTIASVEQTPATDADAKWTGLAGLDKLRVLKTIQFESGVRPFVITPDERQLYVQLSKLHGFVVVDIESGRVTRTVQLPVPPGVTAQRADPHTAHHGMALLAGGTKLCIAGTMANHAAILSVPSLELEGTVPVGREPSWAIASLDGRHCYVSARRGNSVSVISAADRREVKRLPVGDYPQRMWTVRVPERRVAGARR